MSTVGGPRLSTIPTFQNTYSLDFDGVDDYVDCGNSAALKPNIITVSCWIKGSANSAFTRIISQDGPTGGADAYGFYVTTATNKIVFAIKTNVTGTVTSATSGVVLDNNWHHLVGTYDGSEVILYVDGVAVGSPSAGTSILSYGSGTLTIGCFSDPTSLPSYLFNGNIDEVAIFDSVIPIGDLWDGSNQPTDLTPLNPIAWYRMGDNGSYKSPQWLLPNNENKDKVSNYSFELDGIDDYIDCGDSDTFSFGNGVTDSPFSVSMWFNLSSFNTNNVVFSKDSGLPNREYAMGFFGTSKKLRFFIKNQGSNSQQSIDSTTLFSTDTWYNVVCTYDGSGGSNAADGMNIYVNSILETPTNVIKQTYIAMSNTTAPVNIGQYGAAASFLPATVDEVSVYDSELLQADVDSIYGVGEPTTISGAVAHWKMGENATLLTDWTIPDEVGSNDGTSVNMNFLDRVGSAPSSSNNAVSFNMDLIDRVEDTP